MRSGGGEELDRKKAVSELKSGLRILMIYYIPTQPGRKLNPVYKGIRKYMFIV